MLRNIVAQRALILGLVASLGCLASCEESEPVGEELAPNSVVKSDDGITFVTPRFEVPLGDSFTCFYTDYLTEEDLVIVTADGKQDKGGHHIIAYYADEPRPAGYHPCTDQDMVNLHQIGGSAGDGGNVLELPEGLAIQVPKGKQIVLEAHYINTTEAPYEALDWAKIVYGDPAKIKHFVNYMVTNDEAFEIPPNAPLTRTSECVLPRDYDIALLLPHMHELGKHYKLELLDASGAPLQTLIDTDWLDYYVSHPPVQTWEVDAPLRLQQGMRLRQTCEFENSTSDPVIFPREMCLAFSYYFPGEGDLICDMTAVVPE